MSTLANQSSGSRCRVLQVTGSDSTAQRLMEMGLVAGAEIEVVKRAPLGDPMQISLLGYHLSLRKAEARRVRVAP